MSVYTCKYTWSCNCLTCNIQTKQEVRAVIMQMKGAESKTFFFLIC